MPISKEEKQKYIEKFGKDSNDTGSTGVQVAILTHRIRELTDHVENHKKDHHTRRGLVNLVSKRKKLLKFLVRTDSDSYIKLIKELSIRGWWKVHKRKEEIKCKRKKKWSQER